MQAIDIGGQIFGKLTVIKRVKNTRHGQAQWECQCECGKVIVTCGYTLRQGNASSCGCQRVFVPRMEASTCIDCQAQFEYQYAGRGPHRGRCDICHKDHRAKLLAQAARKRYKANPDKYRLASLRSHRKSKYGITPDEFEQILVNQNQCCAACKELNPLREWHVDHDHVTGVVRGILCHHCNIALGLLQDSPERVYGLFTYIKQFKYITMVGK